MDYTISSLSDMVEKYLKDQILSAELLSGAKVVEAEVADALRISRAPVREALRSLSEQGLVVFSPRRGHFVLEMPREEIFEVFQIRITLEVQILRILVSNGILQDTDYDNLTSLSCQMRDAGQKAANASEQTYLLNSLDIGFHRYLWTASKCARRARLLEGLFFQLLIVMNQNVTSLGSCDEKAQEHLTMISALQTNDAAMVCQEFRRHLDKYIIAALGELSPAEHKILETVFQH